MSNENDALLKMPALCDVCGDVAGSCGCEDVGGCVEDVEGVGILEDEVYLKGIVRGLWLLFFLPLVYEVVSHLSAILGMFADRALGRSNIEGKLIRTLILLALAFYVFKVVVAITKRREGNAEGFEERVNRKRLWWAAGVFVLTRGIWEINDFYPLNQFDFIGQKFETHAWSVALLFMAGVMYCGFEVLRRIATAANEKKIIKHARVTVWGILFVAALHLALNLLASRRVIGWDIVAQLMYAVAPMAQFFAYVMVMRYLILLRHLIDKGQVERNLRLREVDRIQEDIICVGCGYNLKGLGSKGDCPECGEAIKGSLGSNISEELAGIELECLECGYSLKGLAADSDCPECGNTVRRSLGEQNIIFDDTGYVRGLILGLWVLICHSVLADFASSFTWFFQPAEIVSNGPAGEKLSVMRTLAFREMPSFVWNCVAIGVFFVFAFYAGRRDVRVLRDDWLTLWCRMLRVLPCAMLGLSVYLYFGLSVNDAKEIELFTRVRYWRYVVWGLFAMAIVGRYIGFVKTIGMGKLVWLGRGIQWVAVFGVLICLVYLVTGYDFETPSMQSFFGTTAYQSTFITGMPTVTSVLDMFAIQIHDLPRVGLLGFAYLMIIGMSDSLLKGEVRRGYLPGAGRD